MGLTSTQRLILWLVGKGVVLLWDLWQAHRERAKQLEKDEANAAKYNALKGTKNNREERTKNAENLLNGT